MKTDSENNLSFILSEHAINERLDQCLAKLMPNYSRTEIQTWIEAGFILVDNKIVKAKTKIKGGEIVHVRIQQKPPSDWEAEAIPLSVVYEDDYFIVINKPVGLIVHPGAGHARHTLLNALLHHAPALKNLPRAGILHRLDKDTSGLLVVAKTPDAFKNLSHQLNKRIILREYQTIVYGRLISGGKINAPIGRHALQRKRMAVIESGKPAITHYRIAEKYPAHTLLQVRLETGRTHQIRVHMAHIHHSVVGDATYGGRVQLTKGMSPELIACLRQFKRQALHAFALGFHHPHTQEWIRFESPLPEDMQHLISCLQADKTLLERYKK